MGLGWRRGWEKGSLGEMWAWLSFTGFKGLELAVGWNFNLLVV